MKREYGELYRELEKRAIEKLLASDIWKKYGSAEKYEQHLQRQEDEYREKKKQEWEAKRKEIWKEHKREIHDAIENAKSGVLSGKGKVQDKNWVAT
jgi:vacuolar-type H+-ATPase subunit H